MHRDSAKYQAAREDDAATILARHGHLIDKVARRVASRSGGVVSAEDLWSSGALGLLEAAERFDSARTTSFEAFACVRIRGAMLDELRRIDHLPRRLRAETERVKQARETLSHKLGREPELAELSDALKIEIDELVALDGVAQKPVALSALFEVQLGTVEPTAETNLEHREISALLTQAITMLPERARILLSLHYVEGLTYREIATVFEVSEVRVFQLHREALAKLREQLESSR